MSISEIFCQEGAIGILQKAFACGKSAHSYIFVGPAGIGRFKTAGEWAKMLLCKNRITENGFTDSCGLCESCRLFEADAHPDFNNIYKELRRFTRDGKDGATPVELPVDVIREFLLEKAQARPVLSERKVFIVSEAEKLNISSQNSLLKVLEEPPGYCCIILLCTSLERLLPTVKSRCQTIRFGPVGEERIVEKLQDMGLEETCARYFARLAQGSLGLACSWAKMELSDANLYRTKKQVVDSISSYEYADALELARRFLDEGKRIAAAWAGLEEDTSKTDINRRAAKTLMRMVISALQDSMRLNVTEQTELINFDQKEQVKKLAERFNTEALAEKIIDADKTMQWIDSAVNERLIFEQLLLNLAVSDKIET